MARSDLLLKLVEAATKGDKRLLRNTLEALIAEERRKQHHILADDLAEFLPPNGREVQPQPARFLTSAHPQPDLAGLVEDVDPCRSLSSLILPDAAIAVIRDLLEENHRADVLRSFGLEPRHRVLLAGPPGNGKTSLAEALAYELSIPLLVVRYEGIVGSFLGETASRLRRVFNHARQRHCVLFFDEFDSIGKERGDAHETGEIKRVVSSLLMQIDEMPSRVLVVAASNHPELLDRAAWRRFQIKLELPPPDASAAIRWLESFASTHNVDLGMSAASIAGAFRGSSFSALEEFATTLLRRRVLDPETPASTHVKRALGEWESRYHPNDIGSGG